MAKKYKSKFKTVNDAYKSKARDRRRRHAAPTGCMVAIVQMLSVVGLAVFALAAIF